MLAIHAGIQCVVIEQMLRSKHKNIGIKKKISPLLGERKMLIHYDKGY